MAKSRRQVALSTPRPTNHEDRLQSAAAGVDAAQARLVAAVRQARQDGLTWTAIARSLGVTPQAVQQRFGRHPGMP